MMHHTSQKNITLEDFINQNDKLLSALGVFIAIVALTDKTSNWALGIVSFVSMGGLILVGYELLSKLDKDLSPRLWLFRYVLLWGGIAFISYWIYEFRTVWDMFLWVPLMLLIFAGILWTFVPFAKKFSFVRKIFGIGNSHKKTYQIFFRRTTIGLILAFSFISAVWVATGVNLIMDAIHKIK